MLAISFSTGRHSPISAIIRWVTGSKVSHAFLTYDDATLGDRWLLEADRGGFTAQRLAIFEKSNVVVVAIPIDLPPEVVRAADRWVGDVGYDYEGLFGNALADLQVWLRLKTRSAVHVWHSARSMFCSEAMVRLLQLGKYPGAEKLVPWKTSPQGLLDFLHRHPPPPLSVI